MKGISVRIELWKSREAKYIILIAITLGVVVGFVHPNARGFRGLVSVYQNDFVLPKDVSVSAQSLKTSTGHSFSFPPPTFVFESIEFMVDAFEVSGGLLHVNFTKDGHVMRTETVFPWGLEQKTSEKIILVHEEYRLGYSETDVVLWAGDAEVRISRLQVQIDRGDREYHPLLMALQFFGVAFFLIVPIVETVKGRGIRRNGFKGG
jgi:hypothetical protein